MRYLRRYGRIILQIEGESALALGQPYGEYDYFIRYIDGEFPRQCAPTWYGSIDMTLFYAKDDFDIRQPREPKKIHRERKKCKYCELKWNKFVKRKILRKGCKYPKMYY